MFMSIDQQLQCKLLNAPTEIRHAIYGYLIPNHVHLSFRNAAFKLSPCVQRINDDDPDCVSRARWDGRRDLGLGGREPLYTYRLRSSWGEHWRCEENMHAAHRTGETLHAKALLRVCKLTFIDFVEMIADAVTIHINDLESLETLIFHSAVDVLASQVSHTATSNFLGYILPNLKVLTISLRIHPYRYKELDDSSGTMAFTSVWTKLPDAISKMSKLHRLRIWLDHSEPRTWSIVNEQNLLSPLDRLTNTFGLNLNIALPKLHPKWETSERHFLDDRTSSGVVIQRRYRQRYHAIESSTGVLEVQHVPDFPILHDMSGMYDMTMDQVEEMERNEWKWGDPEEVLRDMDGQPYASQVV